MNEKPKKIWRKSFTGRTALVIWLAVGIFAIMLGSFIIALLNYSRTMSDQLMTLMLFAGEFLVASLVLIYVVWPLLYWLFWKRWRRTLFALACLATLVALFYAEENWRGKHDWKKYKREWEAKNEKFDFADFVPPPVPDDQNFAMAPIFDTMDKLASRTWRGKHRNQGPADGGSEWDTNLVDRLAMETTPYGEETGTSFGWQRAKLCDLKYWQEYYRALAAKTNQFPVPPQPQSPAQDVLLALSKYDSAIEELREAGQRSDSRFPLDYDDENPAEILLPHLAALKKCCLVLQLRAIAELENGQSEKALNDVKLMLRLTDSIRSEPFIISQLVRFANFQITLQPIYEGLAQHKWSDAQLAELNSELAKLDFLAGYRLSVRGERAAHIKVIDWLEQKRGRYWELLFDMTSYDQQNPMNNLKETVEYLIPKGWFYQNDLMLAQMHQQGNLPAVDDEQQTVSPEKIAQADKAFESIKPFHFLVRLLLPALGNFAKKTAFAQTSVNLARVAIALERYRLGHGEFPESLDSLAPQFIERIPHDIIIGGPLHYRRTNDGQFVLYAVGWNEQDNDGVVVFNQGQTPTVDINQGDWVWRYPKPE
jgi:hypothetical protein